MLGRPRVVDGVTFSAFRSNQSRSRQRSRCPRTRFRDYGPATEPAGFAEDQCWTTLGERRQRKPPRRWRQGRGGPTVVAQEPPPEVHSTRVPHHGADLIVLADAKSAWPHVNRPEKCGGGIRCPSRARFRKLLGFFAAAVRNRLPLWPPGRAQQVALEDGAGCGAIPPAEPWRSAGIKLVGRT
jgi:hypothetical protein